MRSSKNSGTEANLVEGGEYEKIEARSEGRVYFIKDKSLGFYAKCFESPIDNYFKHFCDDCVANELLRGKMGRTVINGS